MMALEATTSMSTPGWDIGELYRRYGPMVLRRVRRFYGSDDAEEVVQEVFLRAMEKLDGFQGRSSPATWLYQLTTRYCINRLRNEGRRRALWLEAGVTHWQQPVSPADQESVAWLRSLWRSLDEEMVLIGLSYYLDGMSHGDIAALLGCSRRTVGNRLEALRALAQDGEVSP